MRKFIHFLQEYTECIAWILAEPTAIDVEYHFYRMHQLEEELREYVERGVKEGFYES